MLPISLEEVSPDHIIALVNEKVSERKTLEYKEMLPDGSDGAKKEFLADVCSLANSSGGDIIYGIRDERDGSGKATGTPESITGLSSANLSAERDRLEVMIRDGIRPRISNVQTREIEIPTHGSVLVLRVGRSWIRPHMVAFRGTSRFYSRHSTGKYQLDVQEIGQAFAEQRSLGEQLRNWRTDRIARILADEGPMRLDGAGKLLLHFVPVSALGVPQSTGLWPLPNEVRNLFRPSSLSSSTAWRYNADGFLVYSLKGANGCASYIQIFRNGCLEYGDGYILNVGNKHGKPGAMPSQDFEQKLIQIFSNATTGLNRFQIEGPVYFSCTLIGVQDFALSRESLAFDFDDVQHTFDRQVIQTPEIEIDRTEPEPFLNSLFPIVNSIWQANGYEETPWLHNWGLSKNRRASSRE